MSCKLLTSNCKLPTSNFILYTVILLSCAALIFVTVRFTTGSQPVYSMYFKDYPQKAVVGSDFDFIVVINTTDNQAKDYVFEVYVDENILFTEDFPYLESFEKQFTVANISEGKHIVKALIYQTSNTYFEDFGTATNPYYIFFNVDAA